MAKCKVVHIGVFFDGTGNNKHIDTQKGAESNIAKLSELYIHGKVTNWSNEQCDHLAHMIYANGVGTYDDKGQFVDRKFEKGAGGGGAKRINAVINTLVALLNKDSGLYRVNEGFHERIIDVFGFSRGAAMARDFINTFYKKNDKLGLTKVRINFVGLYDTVGSFGIAGDNINYKPIDSNLNDEANTHYIKHAKQGIYTADGLSNNSVENVKTVRGFENHEATKKNMLNNGWELKESKQWESDSTFYTMTFIKAVKGFEPYNFVLAHNSAKKIVHMIASDEVRKNFPLSSLSNIASKDPSTGHQEWTYGGVHSDIGGGYAPRMVERHQIDLGEFPNLAQAQAIEKKTKPTLTSDWSFTKIPSTTQLLTPLKDRTHYVTAKFNRIVANDISAITLHRMYEEAIQHKVPFKPISFPMPASMKEYDSHTKANSYSAMSFNGIQELRVKYFHHSAVDQDERDTHYDGNTSIPAVLLDDSPDGIGGNDTRYARTKSGKIIVEREIYPNKGRAIPPTKF
jgi:uncharacterized protein (DUF2235 family)